MAVFRIAIFLLASAKSDEHRARIATQAYDPKLLEVEWIDQPMKK